MSADFLHRSQATRGRCQSDFFFRSTLIHSGCFNKTPLTSQRVNPHGLFLPSWSKENPGLGPGAPADRGRRLPAGFSCAGPCGRLWVSLFIQETQIPCRGSSPGLFLGALALTQPGCYRRIPSDRQIPRDRQMPAPLHSRPPCLYFIN